METVTWHEAVIVGSGFGGAISCCRLAAKWPNKVLLLERGKRYPKGSFARNPHDFAANFWRDPRTQTRKKAGEKLGGLFDIRYFKKMDSVVCAGLGGGSLIYANVFMRPPAWVFDSQWPTNLSLQQLEPYYRVAQSVLGANPIPPSNNDKRRHIKRTHLFAQFASNQNQPTKRADICVFFGNDYANSAGHVAAPLAIGEQQKNRYGATQTSCTYCGECDVGCNVHAKNTVDLNYLHVAEHQFGATIKTQAEVLKIVPLNALQQDDTTANGIHGYRIEYCDQDGALHSVFTKRVVVSAGTLGTNELLLRCRDELGTLPRISQQLGKRFSGNGDFVSAVISGDKAAESNYGPVITQYIDFNLHQHTEGSPAYMLEDAAYPAFLAWYIEGLRPTLNPTYIFKKIVQSIKLFGRFITQTFTTGKWNGSVTAYFGELLKGDLSYRSNVLLFMGKDAGDGQFVINNGQFELHWPQTSSRALYDAIIDTGKRFAAFVKARHYIVQPSFIWPIRNNITVHPLGGCALAQQPENGVVSANDGERGQVFGYVGLYVADGSLLPSSMGANPSATIAAVTEWIAHDITGLTPDDTLGVTA